MIGEKLHQIPGVAVGVRASGKSLHGVTGSTIFTDGISEKKF